MTESLHQRAKALFAELLEMPTTKRAAELQLRTVHDAVLRKEVASLLDYHTQSSIKVDVPPPKIRTKPTFTTSAQSNLTLGIQLARYSPVGIPIVISLMVVAPLLWYVSSAIHDYALRQAAQELTTQANYQLADFQAKQQALVENVSQALQSAKVQHYLGELCAISEKHSAQTNFGSASTALDAELIEAGLDIPLGNSLASAMHKKITFLAWDNEQRTLACSDQGKYVVDGNLPSLPAYRASQIQRELDERIIVRMPDALRLNDFPPLNNDQVSVLCPILGANGSARGVLLIQSEEATSLLNEMVTNWNSEFTKADSYLVTTKGAIVGRSGKTTKDGPLMVLDPGQEITSLEDAARASASWPLTKSAQAISELKNGEDWQGYRNYLGVEVIGVWRAINQQQLGTVVEIPKKQVMQFPRWIDRFLMGSFGLMLTGSIVGLLLFRRRQSRTLLEVGPYKLQEVLGEGGMGKVYLAEHSLLCRPTAVKVLKHEKTELSVLNRFEREVQLASQLTHPNTIAIYDFGRNDDGTFYYAMEYIEGAHLGQLVEFAGPIKPGRCIYVVRQLCHALREAHLAGVVHRDIKPQNIMICNRGGEPDFIKLVDYGLVKAFAPGISSQASQTKIVVGTPRFMAPERLLSPWLADPRVDIYSVGALLYFLLTARLPPLVSALSRESDHMGVETLDLPPEVVDFGKLLSLCMSYDPGERPSSVERLLAELDVLAGRFPWTREDSEEWWRGRQTKLLQFVAEKRKKKSTNQRVS